MKTKLFGTVLVAFLIAVNANANDYNDYKVFFNEYQTEELSVVDIAQEIGYQAAEKFIPLYQRFLLDLEGIIKSTKLNNDVKSHKIENLKIDYAYKFSEILDSYQTVAAINNFSLEYINSRLAVK
ncbi:MAG TPA: hypothetical protein VFC94_01100 [Bacteroidaceae bacterium]|nr:hypothetical protein [Bacteroidaceae bacterium]